VGWPSHWDVGQPLNHQHEMSKMPAVKPRGLRQSSSAVATSREGHRSGLILAPAQKHFRDVPAPKLSFGFHDCVPAPVYGTPQPPPAWRVQSSLVNYSQGVIFWTTKGSAAR
jgi:hypothetical protein